MAQDKKGRKLPKGIRQRSNSSYEGRFTYQYKEYTVKGNSVTETQKRMRELRYKLEHGLYVEKQKMTYDDWFNTWLNEYKKNQVKIGTYESYRRCYESMVKDKIGSRYIFEIRGEHIQHLYNTLVKEKYSISSIQVVAAILNGSLGQALRNGLLEQNPVKMAQLPKQKGKKEGRIAMTKEQQDLFMEYAKESYLYRFFAIMLRTGMRNGELRGLRYTDINRNKKLLHVGNTLKNIPGIGYIDQPPKTKTSERDIPLTEDTLRLLEEQYRFWGFKVEKLGRYLFCNENGEPLTESRVQGEINRIIKRIIADGYDFPYITPHVFRHTFATRAIEAGMQPQVLKTILGHSSLNMTMDLYSHVLPDTKAEEMEKITKAF